MSEQVKDVYDLEVERLTANPEDIFRSWTKADPLFGFVAPNASDPFQGQPGNEDQGCGCLTQIREGEYVAWTDSLTQAIRDDDRIPNDYRDIAPKHLPVFAEWQRRIDKELGRTPPAALTAASAPVEGTQ